MRASRARALGQAQRPGDVRKASAIKTNKHPREESIAVVGGITGPGYAHSCES
jgi:hypothetical protein